MQSAVLLDRGWLPSARRGLEVMDAVERVGDFMDEVRPPPQHVFEIVLCCCLCPLLLVAIKSSVCAAQELGLAGVDVTQLEQLDRVVRETVSAARPKLKAWAVGG